MECLSLYCYEEHCVGDVISWPLLWGTALCLCRRCNVLASTVRNSTVCVDVISWPLLWGTALCVGDVMSWPLLWGTAMCLCSVLFKSWMYPLCMKINIDYPFSVKINIWFVSENRHFCVLSLKLTLVWPLSMKSVLICPFLSIFIEECFLVHCLLSCMTFCFSSKFVCSFEEQISPKWTLTCSLNFPLRQFSEGIRTCSRNLLAQKGLTALDDFVCRIVHPLPHFYALSTVKVRQPVPVTNRVDIRQPAQRQPHAWPRLPAYRHGRFQPGHLA